MNKKISCNSLQWSGLIRMFIGRLIEVGSRINCVSNMLSGEVNRRLFGKCRLTSLSRSGSNFDRVSAVVWQVVSKWVISSACKWWWWC